MNGRSGTRFEIALVLSFPKYSHQCSNKVPDPCHAVLPARAGASNSTRRTGAMRGRFLLFPGRHGGGSVLGAPHTGRIPLPRKKTARHLTGDDGTLKQASPPPRPISAQIWRGICGGGQHRWTIFSFAGSERREFVPPRTLCASFDRCGAP